MKLRGWVEYLILIPLATGMLFLNIFTVPQLFGPELTHNVVVTDFVPVVFVGSVLAFLTGRWGDAYEQAVRSRSVVLERGILVTVLTGTWAVIAGLGLIIGVVPSQILLVTTLSVFWGGVVFFLRKNFRTAPVSKSILPLTSISCLFPWFLGEDTILGSAAGVGLDLSVVLSSVIVYVIGCTVWVLAGQAR